MSWSDWTDYFEGDIWDITEQYGDDAAAAIQDKVEEYLQEFQDAIDVADSDDEMEDAQDRLEDFVFTQSEADEIGQRYEDEFLYEYMSRSKKDDMDKIDRYLESIGAGNSGGGGGGGGGGSRLTPIQQLQKLINQVIKDIQGLISRGVKSTEREEEYLRELQEELYKLQNPEEDI